MDSFVSSTPRVNLDEPAPPKSSIGKLSKGERPTSLPRGMGELHKYVAEWEGWGMKAKNAGSEQFRYIVRTMFETEKMLRTSEKTIKDFGSEVRGWKKRVNEQDAAAVFETGGERMLKRLDDLGGSVKSRHLDKVYPPSGGMMGRVNEAVLAMQVWIDDERNIKSGDQIIQDRLIFAATNLAPLLSLRSSLVYEISAAQKLVTEWQRVFTEEKKAARITQAEAARTKSKKQRTERTSPSAAPVQERCAAIKAWPGQPGVEAAIPLTEGEIVWLLRDEGDGWSNVRRESDGTEGLVPSKRLRKAPPPPPEEAEPEPEPEADPAPAPPPAPEVSTDTDDGDMEGEAAVEAIADEQFVEATRANDLANELAHMEADAAECGYDGD